jgi:hypothetical protein
MKNLFCLALFFIMPGAIFAGEFNYSFPVQNKFAGDFNIGLAQQPAVLLDKSIVSRQPFQSRNDIFLNLSKMEYASNEIAFLMNFLSGFGSGSFAQGDVVGGVIGLSGELCGLGIIVGSILMIDEHNPNPNIGMIASGFMLIVSTRVFELFRALVY